jgi:nicotinamidase-related amidase
LVGRVQRDDCVLVVVDVQDRLIGTITEHEAVVENLKSLIKAAVILQVPILATEQEKLGETIAGIRSLLPDTPTRKISFSCCDSLEFMTKLSTTGRKTVILCGIETHICVAQTALDLVGDHLRVLVVKDATSSYESVDRETAIRRMETSGAEITTTEAVIYELTQKAGTEVFRRILEIVKERRTRRSNPH